MIASSRLHAVNAALPECIPNVELGILVRNRPFNVFVCGRTHGWAGDEKRVQPKGYQYGKE